MQSTTITILFLFLIFITSCTKVENEHTNEEEGNNGLSGDKTEEKIDLNDPIFKNIATLRDYRKKLEDAKDAAQEKIINYIISENDYAPKNQFESDIDYYKRICKHWPELLKIEKDECVDIWDEIRKIRSQTYDVSDFPVELGGYDANKEEYTLIIGPYEKYGIGQANLVVKISKDNAKKLFDNWTNKIVETKLILSDNETIKPLRFKISEQKSGFIYEKEYTLLREQETPLQTDWISPDNKFVIGMENAGRGSTIIFIRSLENGQQIFARSYELDVLQIKVSNKGKYLAVGTKHRGGYAYRNMVVYDLQKLETVIKDAYTALIISVSFSPNDTYVAAGAQRDRHHTRSLAGIYVYSLTNNRIFRQVEYEYGSISSAFSDDGKYLAMIEANQIYFYDFMENKLLNQYTISESFGGFRDISIPIIYSFSPDAKYLYTSGGVFWTNLE